MQKIKHFFESDKGKDFLVVLIVILVGLGSFELGRLSKEDKTTGIKIEGSDGTKDVTQTTSGVGLSTSNNSNNNTGRAFFASNRGSKYYFISCSAGKTIKQENRVWFNTSEEAERAGYTLSSACQ